MSDESWDQPESASTTRAPNTSVRLGFGRGQPLSNNSNPPASQPSRWNSAGGNFNTSNDTNQENKSDGFGSNNSQGNFRREFRDNNQRESGSSAFRSGDDGGSRACYNCNQVGHMSRECTEPRKEHGGPRDRGNRNFPSDNDSNRGQGFRSSGFGGNSNSQWNQRRDAQNQDFSNNYQTDSERSNFGSGGRYPMTRNTHDSSGFQSGGFNDGKSFGPREFVRSNRDGDHAHSREKGPRNQDDRNNHDGENPKRVEYYAPERLPNSESEIFDTVTERGENFVRYQHSKVSCTPEGKVRQIEMYNQANLHPSVLKNISLAGFQDPTTIQCYTIPAIRDGHDLMACAQTGSGKTAAFLLPIISNLLTNHNSSLYENHEVPSPLCLILSPTRELALQTEREARKFAFNTPIIPAHAVGGHDIRASIDLLREGCHILSATTGRLVDMVERRRISLSKVLFFVFDEADRMLDQDFENDVRKIQSLGLPPNEKRYTSMFSATFPPAVQNLAKRFLRKDYIFLVVGSMGGANEDISQTIEEVRQGDKKNRLIELLDANLKSERCLIFVETKRSADYLGALLSQKGLMSTTMHGDRTQQQREAAVRDFSKKKCQILVATSVAARGLDFPLIGYVVNYDLPDSSDFYIHRIGRTGRAGHLGKSISFFDPDRDSDRRIASDLVAKLSEASQPIPDFLQSYGSGAISTGPIRHNDVRMRPRDMDSGRNHFQSGIGGSASAGGATNEDWD